MIQTESDERLDARALATLCAHLDAQPDLGGVLALLMHFGVDAADSARCAGVIELARRGPRAVAWTHDSAHEWEQQQLKLQVGPALTLSASTQPVLRTDDLCDDKRWGRLAPLAAAHGLRSSLAMRLAPSAGATFILTLYSSDSAAFDADDEANFAVLATHATIAVGAASLTGNLRTALLSRDVIGQAKGILIERFKIDETEAFKLITAVSQRTHRKLRDVADDLATYGQFTRLD